MKKLVLLVVSLTLVAGPSIVYGVGMFGPPEPAGKPGNISFGFGYFTSDNRWHSNVLRHLCVDQNHWFIDGAYTFNPQWEVFGRLGVAGVRLADGYLFRDGNKLFGTAGLRGLIVQSERAAIGIIVQASAYDRYDETQTSVDRGQFSRVAQSGSSTTPNSGLQRRSSFLTSSPFMVARSSMLPWRMQNFGQPDRGSLHEKLARRGRTNTSEGLLGSGSLWGNRLPSRVNIRRETAVRQVLSSPTPFDPL